MKITGTLKALIVTAAIAVSLSTTSGTVLGYTDGEVRGTAWTDLGDVAPSELLEAGVSWEIEPVTPDPIGISWED
jgi:hypothetical protein